eukprot:356000-Chlamydomonas_euryale.AAC.6
MYDRVQGKQEKKERTEAFTAQAAALCRCCQRAGKQGTRERTEAFTAQAAVFLLLLPKRRSCRGGRGAQGVECMDCVTGYTAAPITAFDAQDPHDGNPHRTCRADGMDAMSQATVVHTHTHVDP